MKLNYNKVAPWLSGLLITSGCVIGAFRGGYLVDFRMPGISLYVAPSAPAAASPAPLSLPAPTPAPVLAAPAAAPEPEPEPIPDYQQVYDSSLRNVTESLVSWLPVAFALYLGLGLLGILVKHLLKEDL